jgi:prepilin-type N-terminal cleavage/methylation domain-containing protein
MQLQGYQPLNRAYTLIEILIALTIVGIVFVIGYAGFRDFARRQTVISMARNIKSDLRLAQEMALSSKKPDGCSVLDGYEFNVSNVTQEYTISARCSGAAQAPVKTVEMPENIAITKIPAFGEPILFKVLGQGTNLPQGSLITLKVGFEQAIEGTMCSVFEWLPGCTWEGSIDVVITSGGEIK